MTIIKTPIDNLVILEPDIFQDDRGYFYESYNQKKFHDVGLTANFVQDNESYSHYGTIRGLHFQKGEHAQAKLVRVTKGTVLDVAVDLRTDSKTFGHYFSVELSESNKRLFFVPKGFAHGFSVLSNDAIFNYKCDHFYHKQAESGIVFNDATLHIDWKISTQKQIVSEKDIALKTLKEIIQEKEL